MGVPSRGLHGKAYRGHIFWDELFIFPYLNLRLLELTRALLMYRYRRLPEARVAARKAGYEGAMYPWQSGSDGREESQVVHLNPQSGRFEMRDDVLWINPCLPDPLSNVHFRLRYRRNWIAVDLTAEKLRLTIGRSRNEPVKIGFQGEVRQAEQGDVLEFALDRHC